MQALQKQAMLAVKAATTGQPTLAELVVTARLLTDLTTGRRLQKQAFFTDAIMDTIDNFIKIAVPLAAIYGDFELSTLLGSLKIWLDKRKREAQAEWDLQQAIQSQSFSDIRFD